MNLGVENFDRAESQRINLQQKLQVTSDELICILLLILAKDIGVGLPSVFNKLLSNHTAFLDPDTSGGLNLNAEKYAIWLYCGKMSISVPTLNLILCNLALRKRGISGITSIIPGDSLPELQAPVGSW